MLLGVPDYSKTNQCWGGVFCGPTLRVFFVWGLIRPALLALPTWDAAGAKGVLSLRTGSLLSVVILLTVSCHSSLRGQSG